MVIYTIIAGYLIITLFAGFYYYKKSKDTPEDYFLAGRNVGTIILFFTLIATNFSAFFFLGFAGAGYRIGYSYYTMMTFGTILAALSFYLIGHKVWLLGKERKYVTPSELIFDLTKNNVLRILYVIVMVLFTLPYLALQPIGAGYILETLTNGEVSYFTGATFLTVFIVFYVFLGGMRSVAMTDLIQGILMFVLIFVAVYVIAEQFGGLTKANEAVYKIKPELFSREGAGGYFTKEKWFSFMLLWICCLPMFPHMFMRFYISKSAKTLKTSTILYTLVPSVLFICPVIIGVLGHLSFPELQGKEADHILPKMMMMHAPEWLAALIMVGALAAFMSTLDSQLLALSTILTRDVYMSMVKKEVSFKKQVWIGRALIIILAIIGLIIAYHPADTIFIIAKQTFTGYAVLFPATLAILHFKKVNSTSCVISIIVGELIVVGLYTNIIPNNLTLGFEPVIPIILISSLIIMCGSALTSKKSRDAINRVST